MTREERISNRNIKIVAAYTTHRTGSCSQLFEGLPFPVDQYASPEMFFLNEDEWTTFENFLTILRKAKKLVNEPNFYFNCGASAARLKSWGRFHYFVRVFATPNDGFQRLPFFNENFNDTKKLEIIIPPELQGTAPRYRTVFKIRHHPDIDPHKDFIRDPYFCGIISAIPTIWGLQPAVVKHRLLPYDPVRLLSEEPELKIHGMAPEMEDGRLTVRDPANGRRISCGKTVLLAAESVNGREEFLGAYKPADSGTGPKGLLITRTVQVGEYFQLSEGQIYKAPFFITEATYERLSFVKRLSQVFKFKNFSGNTEAELIDTINRLKQSILAKNTAYRTLQEAHLELHDAKEHLHRYALELEEKVAARTLELSRAQNELLELNKDLEATIEIQVDQLEKYNNLRRYLSPKFTEMVLNGACSFDGKCERKMMTVMFTDIRNFSALTDSLEPEEIVHLLDLYLQNMVDVIHKHDGTLNKIVGDGLLIFFGDPVPMEDHASKAVKVAVEMQHKALDLRSEWLSFGHDLAIGIGMNTGFMTVGTIGAENHRDYTVIGNQVNVAARLVSLAKPGQILISSRTFSHVQNGLKARDIGEINVKGIHTPVHSYEVLWSTEGKDR
ncbi:MAG: adenylate/guanylate cyclase domain-containing protein [Desulfatiglandaceae bacterium]